MKTYTVIVEVYRDNKRYMVITDGSSQSVIDEFLLEGIDKHDKRYRYRVLYVLLQNIILYDIQKIELESLAFNDRNMFVTDIRNDFMKYLLGNTAKIERFINE